MSQNTTNDGGPAFPVPNYVNASGETHESKPNGMSLRDYFAAKAMQAMVGTYRRTLEPQDADDDTNTVPFRELLLDRNGVTGEYEGAKEVAGDAYIIADAMLEERKKGGAS